MCASYVGPIKNIQDVPKDLQHIRGMIAHMKDTFIESRSQSPIHTEIQGVLRHVEPKFLFIKLINEDRLIVF